MSADPVAADHLGWVKNGLVKDLIDEAEYPKKKVTVKYPTCEIDGCAEVKAWQVFTEPALAWEEEEKDDYHTIIMTDPDAPSRKDPKWGEWLHWIVINVKNNDIANGKVICPYVGCGAPEGTGLHRYTIMVCKQIDGEMLEYKGKTWDYTAPGRECQKFREFKESHNLKVIAGNCFQAEYDWSVPKLYAQLGDEKVKSCQAIEIPEAEAAKAVDPSKKASE